jgi:hypothetical protein
MATGNAIQPVPIRGIGVGLPQLAVSRRTVQSGIRYAPRHSKSDATRASLPLERMVRAEKP